MQTSQTVQVTDISTPRKVVLKHASGTVRLCARLLSFISSPRKQTGVNMSSIRNTSIRITAVIMLLTCLPATGRTQSLDQARKLYGEGRYAEAMPAFEKLVRQSPNNSSYNLWYGVCCYETNDLTTAEIYLQAARKRKAVDASRYLAQICRTQYRFGEASALWEEYIEQMSKKQEDTADAEIQLEQTLKLQRMMEKTEDVRILDSIVVDRNELLSTYFLSEDCGRIERFDTHFPTSSPSTSTVYVNPKGDLAYYARPSEDGRQTLYTHFRLQNAWTDEKPVFPDDPADNSYPFVLGDGRTLYFASKDNGSIGGYDLFVTRYNLAGNTYLTPEQMGMPFNSPANDYLMVIDEIKGVGWFVSDRNQPEGKVCVYLFLPDESRKRLDPAGDEERLRQRAMLASIRDTRTDAQDFTALIQAARTGAEPTATKQKKDFEFIVNDRATYFVWSDFRNAEAKSFYEKAAGLKKQAASVAGKLAEARELYASDPSARERLRASILQSEQELETLDRQAEEWEKKARNRENVQLKNK